MHWKDDADRDVKTFGKFLEENFLEDEENKQGLADLFSFLMIGAMILFAFKKALEFLAPIVVAIVIFLFNLLVGILLLVLFILSVVVPLIYMTGIGPKLFPQKAKAQSYFGGFVVAIGFLTLILSVGLIFNGVYHNDYSPTQWLLSATDFMMAVKDQISGLYKLIIMLMDGGIIFLALMALLAIFAIIVVVAGSIIAATIMFCVFICSQFYYGLTCIFSNLKEMRPLPFEWTWSCLLIPIDLWMYLKERFYQIPRLF